jgi:thiol-disulfide isomerase/thioredoxin
VAKGLIIMTTALIGCRDGAPSRAPRPDPDGRWRVSALERLDAGRVEALVPEGHGLVVAALWATWCDPCIAEMPELEAFQAAHPEVVVLGLATDPPEVVGDKIQAVLDRVRPRYPQAVLAGGEGAFLGRLALAWDGVLPKTVAIAADGRRFLIESPVTRRTLEAALAPYLGR